jgi:hypothetical protein
MTTPMPVTIPAAGLHSKSSLHGKASGAATAPAVLPSPSTLNATPKPPETGITDLDRDQAESN